ncbi:MAG TPA: hypothetical protein VK461_08800 [Acidimicrobiales bacterium]|nr:hypothetical protein [Acidimicrobiales bacterium]
MKHHPAQLGHNLLDSCCIDAYRTWKDRRSAPAYMRGVPTWMWQSAVRCSPY